MRDYTLAYTKDVTDDLRKLFKENEAYVQWDKNFNFWQGTIFYEENVKIEPHTLQVNTSGRLYEIGAFSYIRSTLPTDTTIGRYTSIASNVTTFGEGHPGSHFSTSPVFYKKDFFPFSANEKESKSSLFQKQEWDYHAIRKPITIGNDVWIGQDVVLKDGITIGDGAIIGQGALVTKDVPPYASVGGVPAKVIRYRFEEEIIGKLKASKWWTYAYWDFCGINTEDRPEVFLKKLNRLIEEKALRRYQPQAITFKDLSK